MTWDDEQRGKQSLCEAAHRIARELGCVLERHMRTPAAERCLWDHDTGRWRLGLKIAGTGFVVVDFDADLVRRCGEGDAAAQKEGELQLRFKLEELCGKR